MGDIIQTGSISSGLGILHITQTWQAEKEGQHAFMPSKEGSKISPFSSIVLAFFKMYDGEMKGKNAKLQAHELLKFEQSQLFILQNNSTTEQRLPLHQAQESHFG